MDVNLNQNMAECLQKTFNVGSTVVQNICNERVYTIPWGGADWMLFAFLSVLALGLCAVVLMFVLMMIGDVMP